MPKLTPAEKQELNNERWELLEEIERWLEQPMMILGFVWLALAVLQLTRGLSPLLTDLTWLIWALFIIDFVIRFTLAPAKVKFVKSNWLTLIALAVPALRIFSFLRFLRLLRVAGSGTGSVLLRLVSSANRGMRALGSILGRRGFPYVMAVSVIVMLAGAAGIFAFEHGPNGIPNFGTALWWSSMILTTMGSDYWPHSAGGRLLCVILAVYAFAMFGYVTATVASFFVARDADNDQGEVAGTKQIRALQSEVAMLRVELQAFIQANTRKAG